MIRANGCEAWVRRMEAYRRLFARIEVMQEACAGAGFIEGFERLDKLADYLFARMVRESGYDGTTGG